MKTGRGHLPTGHPPPGRRPAISRTAGCMGKGVKPLLFSLSLLFFFLYAGGWDPLEPSYQPSLPTVIKYGCLNITLPKAVLYNQYGEAVEFPPRGVYILSFGYTYCPDVCPLTFAVLNATWRLSKLPIYVVSVDPPGATWLGCPTPPFCWSASRPVLKNR